MVAIDEQSPDIAQGVDQSYEVQHDPGDDDPLDLVGAGDQGMMFGYATDETDELMPLPITLAHLICKRLAEVRKADVLPYLRPDGKSQVTIRYETDEHGHQRPVEIVRVLISTQHRDGLDADTLIKPDLAEHVLRPILPGHLYDEKRLLAQGLLLLQPDRQVRDRRADGRHRPDRPEDHRRHLRRHGPPRRRCVLGQGPDQGRPLGGLRGALCGEERRRRGARQPLRAPGRLRDRRRAPGLGRGRAASAPRANPASRRSRSSSASTSTCARRRSSATSTCAGRSMRRPRRTAISAATTTTSPGSAPTRPRRSAMPRASAAATSGYARRTNSPAAARSPTSRSSPFSPTVSWPAAGCASRTSISAPGTSPWS